jgi:diketogulonate reductase-like aldo/keto reductase
MLGLGVWQVPNGPECVNAVRWALDLGCAPRLGCGPGAEG